MTSVDLDKLAASVPVGAAHGTSVKALAWATGLSERAVREGLRTLVVERHLPIVTLPTERGVYYALSDADIAPARAHLRNKLVSLRERIDALEIAARNLAWRPTLFDLEGGSGGPA